MGLGGWAASRQRRGSCLDAAHPPEPFALGQSTSLYRPASYCLSIRALVWEGKKPQGNCFFVALTVPIPPSPCDPLNITVPSL